MLVNMFVLKGYVTLLYGNKVSTYFPLYFSVKYAIIEVMEQAFHISNSWTASLQPEGNCKMIVCAECEKELDTIPDINDETWLCSKCRPTPVAADLRQSSAPPAPIHWKEIE